MLRRGRPGAPAGAGRLLQDRLAGAGAVRSRRFREVRSNLSRPHAARRAACVRSSLSHSCGQACVRAIRPTCAATVRSGAYSRLSDNPLCDPGGRTRRQGGRAGSEGELKLWT